MVVVHWVLPNRAISFTAIYGPAAAELFLGIWVYTDVPVCASVGFQNLSDAIVSACFVGVLGIFCML